MSRVLPASTAALEGKNRKWALALLKTAYRVSYPEAIKQDLLRNAKAVEKQLFETSHSAHKYEVDVTRAADAIREIGDAGQHVVTEKPDPNASYCASTNASLRKGSGKDGIASKPIPAEASSRSSRRMKRDPLPFAESRNIGQVNQSEIAEPEDDGLQDVLSGLDNTEYFGNNIDASDVLSMTPFILEAGVHVLGKVESVKQAKNLSESDTSSIGFLAMEKMNRERSARKSSQTTSSQQTSSSKATNFVDYQKILQRSNKLRETYLETIRMIYSQLGMSPEYSEQDHLMSLNIEHCLSILEGLEDPSQKITSETEGQLDFVESLFEEAMTQYRDLIKGIRHHYHVCKASGKESGSGAGGPPAVDSRNHERAIRAPRMTSASDPTGGSWGRDEDGSGNSGGHRQGEHYIENNPLVQRKFKALKAKYLSAITRLAPKVTAESNNIQDLEALAYVQAILNRDDMPCLKTLENAERTIANFWHTWKHLLNSTNAQRSDRVARMALPAQLDPRRSGRRTVYGLPRPRVDEEDSTWGSNHVLEPEWKGVPTIEEIKEAIRGTGAPTRGSDTLINDNGSHNSDQDLVGMIEILNEVYGEAYRVIYPLITGCKSPKKAFAMRVMMALNGELPGVTFQQVLEIENFLQVVLERARRGLMPLGKDLYYQEEAEWLDDFVKEQYGEEEFGEDDGYLNSDDDSDKDEDEDRDEDEDEDRDEEEDEDSEEEEEGEYDNVTDDEENLDAGEDPYEENVESAAQRNSGDNCRSGLEGPRDRGNAANNAVYGIGASTAESSSEQSDSADESSGCSEGIDRRANAGQPESEDGSTNGSSSGSGSDSDPPMPGPRGAPTRWTAATPPPVQSRPAGHARAAGGGPLQDPSRVRLRSPSAESGRSSNLPHQPRTSGVAGRAATPAARRLPRLGSTATARSPARLRAASRSPAPVQKTRPAGPVQRTGPTGRSQRIASPAAKPRGTAASPAAKPRTRSPAPVPPTAPVTAPVAAPAPVPAPAPVQVAAQPFTPRRSARLSAAARTPTAAARTATATSRTPRRGGGTPGRALRSGTTPKKR